MSFEIKILISTRSTPFLKSGATGVDLTRFAVHGSRVTGRARTLVVTVRESFRRLGSIRGISNRPDTRFCRSIVSALAPVLLFVSSSSSSSVSSPRTSLGARICYGIELQRIVHTSWCLLLIAASISSARLLFV